MIQINRFFNLIDLYIAISDTRFSFSVTGASRPGMLFEPWLLLALGKPALGLLFVFATADERGRILQQLADHPPIYPLSPGVDATSWSGN